MLWKALLGSLITLTILAGCATSDKPSHKNLSKNESLAIDQQPEKNLSFPANQKRNERENTKEQLAFIKEFAFGAGVFKAEHAQLLKSLSQETELSLLAQASMVLGIVNALNSGKRELISAIRVSSQSMEQNSAISLESLCLAWNLNLEKILEENPILQSAGVSEQILKALDQFPTSPSFHKSILNAVSLRTRQWAQLSKSFEEPVSAPLAQPVSPPETDMSDASPLNPADLKGGDSSLTEAQTLADRGDYKLAVKKAKSLSSASPMHGAAQEKIKEFSNRGVQELRKKAAEAFQNATPINDPRARVAYLLQAKNYLEEAIADYPDSTVLPTVKENLQFILRDLDLMRKAQ